PRVANREREVLSCTLLRRAAVRRPDLGLGALQAFDLSSHGRQMTRIEGQQGRCPRVIGSRGVCGKEAPREVGASEALEVHRQKGGFVRYVVRAKGPRELDAVEDVDARGEGRLAGGHHGRVDEADVLGVEVTMALPDPPAMLASAQ